MALGLTYRMSITNKEGTDFTCDISDITTIGTADENTIIPLQGSGQPLVLSVTDNDENKFTPIRAKKLSIRFLSTVTENLNNFITDKGDNAFRVKLYTSTYTVFIGGLVISDIKQDFLDDSTARVVELTATDGIALLKDIPLTDDNSKNPRGYFRIIQHIVWALKKTGLSLPVNVMNNLMLVSFPLAPGYDRAYIQSKTFEDEIGTSINCYEVLSRILGDECYLTQWKGEWWIRRVDEYETGTNYYDTYDTTATLINQVAGADFHKNIGLGLPVELVVPAALVSAVRPYASIKEVFQYEYPKEIIDNIDFSRGNFLSIVSLPANDSAYAIDDWQTIGGVTAYIRRSFENNYEKERYVVIPPGIGSTEHYIQSNPVPIQQNDKFTFNIDWRLTTNLNSGGSATVFAAQIRLFGDDGSFWTVTNVESGSEAVGDWIRTNSSFTINNRYIQNVYSINVEDETKWMSAGVDSKPLPVSGNLVFLLREFTAKGRRETHLTNLRFEYLPYINGSYQKYTGQYNKVSQAGDFKATLENNVYIADSPKKIFKGALFTFNTVTQQYPLAGQWYNGSPPFIRPGTDPIYYHTLGFIQAYDVWNQYRRSMRLMDASLAGIDSATELPDLMHTYFFLDSSPHTTGKRFMLVHFEIDLYHATWKGFFAEVYDFFKPKIYTDTLEFKYVEKR